MKFKDFSNTFSVKHYYQCQSLYLKMQHLQFDEQVIMSGHPKHGHAYHTSNKSSQTCANDHLSVTTTIVRSQFYLSIT